MIDDKLTRAERLRLETFNQVNLRYPLQPTPLDEHLREAEQVEAWLKAAREDS